MRLGMFWAAVICLTFVMLGPPLAGASDEITVKGAVYGEQWDDKGNVLAVSILTTTGDELFVEHTVLGDELLKKVEQNITVTGTVKAENDGKKHFTVSKYEIAFN